MGVDYELLLKRNESAQKCREGKGSHNTCRKRPVEGGRAQGTEEDEEKSCGEKYKKKVRNML